jgi:putative phage-type endonuclease
MIMEQRSPEWYAKRLGKVTASRTPDVMAKTKAGQRSASWATYMGELIAETLTGVPTEKYTTAAMQRGVDVEAEGRAAYQFETATLVTEIGFVEHPTIAMAGASPDGLIGTDGLLEIKCPNTATHIETLLGQSVPAKYQTQMQFQMACTGRAWVDFVSFDSRLPESMSLFIKRVPRDDKLIAEIEKQVTEFLSELDDKIAQLGKRYEIKRAA